MDEYHKRQQALAAELDAVRRRATGEAPGAPAEAPGLTVGLFAAAAEAMQLGLTVTDRDGRILYTNPAEARMHGYTVDELLGEDARVLAPTGQWRRLRPAALAELGTWRRESVNRRKDGSAFPVLLWSDVVRDPAGSPLGLVTLSEDLSPRHEAERTAEALRHSEAEYRALVEQATYGIYRSTPDGRFLGANPALVRMLGYDSEDEVLALDMEREVYHDPKDRARFLAEAARSAAITGLEVAWKRRGGQVITVRLSGRAVRGPDGSLTGFEMFAEDVTAQRALEAQLRQAQKMELLGQWTGGIAHDFNNILTVILASAEVLGKSLPRDRRDLHADLEELRAAGRRGTAMVARLLSFGRHRPLVLEPLDLGALVEELEATLRRLLPETIVLDIRRRAGMPRIQADVGVIEQILFNLVTNARDAMPRGGRLTIATSRAVLDAAQYDSRGWGDPGEYAVLEVRDAGTGMDEATRAKVFEPFFTTKATGHGTGLGMAMVYGLVKQHHGYIDLESAPGVGTTVRVYFPVSAEEVAVAVPAAARAAVRGGRETILVAEDEAPIRRATQRLLEQYGYRVRVAANGAEALEMLRADPEGFDLVVTDVVMPELTGGDLYRAAREEIAGLKFLFMSGYVQREVRKAAQLDPAAVLLEKPWVPLEFVRSVREVLDAVTPAS